MIQYNSDSISSSILLSARPSLSTPQHPSQADMRKHGHPPISSVAPDSMAPWEGSSHSESSFTSFPPPLSPLPLAHSKPITAPDPPLPPPTPSQIKNIEPENGQNARVKRKPLPPRHPSRPSRLPPLRQVTNLSFSRNFTFSFFELPVHQSARSRAERLRDLTVLLRQFQYWGKTYFSKFTSGAEKLCMQIHIMLNITRQWHDIRFLD